MSLQLFLIHAVSFSQPFDENQTGDKLRVSPLEQVKSSGICVAIKGR